jgi:phosphate ABC transporter phosphate-binding protein
MFPRVLIMSLMAASALVAGERVYVEPFTTHAQAAAALRDDLMGELRKSPLVALAGSESEADLILGGGGDVWVKGYRSLNPRSGRSPSDGVPIYGGYLSVELRDRSGATVWSYLATPSAGDGDVSRDLARNIGKRVAAALSAHRPGSASSGSATAANVKLRGAGATFPFPVYEKWFGNYRREFPQVEISYDPVGSQAGIGKLEGGEVDFAGSDSPEGSKGYLYFPAVVGAVVPIINLPGVTGEIAFTPEVLAGIYLGTIRKWNDPAIARSNKGTRLPDLDITVVHRSDGSGTSYAWTDYLSKSVPAWKERVGAGLAPQWPVGRSATGNDGVAKMVKELGGAIGYVEFIYALRNRLSYGKVRNAKGEFVAASLESIEVAANETKAMGDDLKVSIVNAPGTGAYPIASFTWFVVPEHIKDEVRRKAMADFLNWMTGPGQTQAAALGYLPLPKDVIARETEAIARIH